MFVQLHWDFMIILLFFYDDINNSCVYMWHIINYVTELFSLFLVWFYICLRLYENCHDQFWLKNMIIKSIVHMQKKKFFWWSVYMKYFNNNSNNNINNKRKRKKKKSNSHNQEAKETALKLWALGIGLKKKFLSNKRETFIKYWKNRILF